MLISGHTCVDEKVPLPEEVEEIKEYHFHVYFFQENKESCEAAAKLRNKIIELIDKRFFNPVPYHTVNHGPLVWCPKEHFSRVYSWFLLHRNGLSVMIHPLTINEVKDHTENVTWMGKSIPLDITQLSDKLPEVPAQYPELKMGYSAPK
nr:70_t:CDS:2 [Entrophospora candida]